MRPPGYKSLCQLPYFFCWRTLSAVRVAFACFFLWLGQPGLTQIANF
jgi:hypothetical protein